jgi:hypothetical protein
MSGAMFQVVECLPSKLEALSSNPSPLKIRIIQKKTWGDGIMVTFQLRN